MPKIRINQIAPNEVQSPGPVSVASSPADFGAQEYAGAAQLGQGLEDTGTFLEKRATQGEVSKLHAGIFDLTAAANKELTKRAKTADPNDETFVDNFMDWYKQQSDKLGEGIQTPGGQNFFERSNEHLKTSMLQSAISAHAELAGIAQRQDIETSVNNASSSLIDNPTQFDMIKTQFSAGMAAMVASGDGSISKETALTLQDAANKEFAKSAVLGWANIKPDYAKAQVESGRWDEYFKGDLKEQMLGKIQQHENAKRIEQERAEKLKQQAIAAAQMQTQGDFLKKLVDGSLDTKQVLNSNLDAFGSGSQEQFLKLLQQGAQDKINNTDPTTFRNLLDRINKPDGDPNKLVNENDLIQYTVDGRVGFSDMQKLRGEIQGKRTEAGSIEGELKKGLLEVAKGTLTKSNALTGLKDPVGDEQLQKFTSYFLTEFQKQRQAGKSAVDLLTPGSKDYLGTALQNYVRTPQQIMQDMVGGLNRKPVVANPAPDNQGPPPPPKTEETVSVINAEGKRGKIPKSQLDDAIKNHGFIRAQ